MSERIAVVGAGAVGGYVAGKMAAAGHDVTLIDPWPEHIEAIRADGLRLSGHTEAETATVRLPAWHLTELERVSRERGFDIAFICMKAYDTEWAALLIRGYMAPGGCFVSLQNGINEDRLAGVVGWPRTLGCIASMIAVHLHAPGRIHRQVPLGGDKHTVFRIGEAHGRMTPRARRIAEILSAADSSKATTNLWGERWSKLTANTMRNGLSAASGMGSASCDRDPELRWLTIRLAGEAVKVGHALGHDLEAVYGFPASEFAAALDGDGDSRARIEDELLRRAGNTDADVRPSMAQDIMKGRRTEIDYLNGLVAARGRELGIPTPANDALIDAVRRVERGEVPPGREAVAGL